MTSALRRAGPWVAVPAVAAAVWIYYVGTFHNWKDFSFVIDGHCPQLFCDFQNFFYAEGQQVLTAQEPVSGYFYSAPFALGLAMFRGMPYDEAFNWWAFLQAVALAVLFAVPLLLVPKTLRQSGGVLAAYTLAFATSVPILHNVKWGQISVLLRACTLSALWLEESGRSVAAGALLAVPITIKYYPALFLSYFVLRRNWRAVAASAITIVLFFAGTVAVLGLEHTLDFQLFVQHALGDAERARLAADPNSQYFAHVVPRWLGAAAGGPRAQLALDLAGAAVLVASLGLLWLIQRRRPDTTTRWAAVLLFGATPFWVPTSWPHYFSYLPALQLLTLAAVLEDRRGSGETFIQIALLAASVAASSSLVLLEWFVEWAPYSRAGLPLVSNILVLLVAYRQALAAGASRSANAAGNRGLRFPESA